MAFTLFPKSIRFFDMLLKQNQILKDVAADLNLIFGDISQIDEAFKRINVKETEADELCREIARQISQTLITPIDREDIYRINLTQEDCINSLKNIAARARVSGFDRILFAARKMMHNANEMIIHTGEMLETLKKQQEVSDLVRQIKNLKGESEMLLGTGLSELQDKEAEDLKAVVTIIKWVQVYDRIEQVTERIDDLSDAIEEVVLKNA